MCICTNVYTLAAAAYVDSMHKRTCIHTNMFMCTNVYTRAAAACVNSMDMQVEYQYSPTAFNCDMKLV